MSSTITTTIQRKNGTEEQQETTSFMFDGWVITPKIYFNEFYQQINIV